MYYTCTRCCNMLLKHSCLVVVSHKSVTCLSTFFTLSNRKMDFQPKNDNDTDHGNLLLTILNQFELIKQNATDQSNQLKEQHELNEELTKNLTTTIEKWALTEAKIANLE